MLGSLTWLFLPLAIQGAGLCPVPAEVERQLRALVSSEVDTSTRDQVLSLDEATVTEQSDGSLDVSLASPGGRVSQHKTLPASISCAERAEIVALTLAIWEAQIHPEIALRLDRFASDEAGVVGPRAAGTSVDRATPVVRPPEPAPASAVDRAFGLGLLGVGQESPAPGVRADFLIGPAAQRWRARLSATAVGARTISVPPGDATWSRAYGVAGADALFWRGGSWALAGGSGMVLGVLKVDGAGYAANRRAWNVDLGVELGLRLEGRAPHIRPWLGLQATIWLRRQDLEVTGASGKAALPRFDPGLALGVDFLL